MIRGFAILLLCQLAGEALVRALALPLPGPVLGLVFLVAGLAWWRRTPEQLAVSDVGRVSDGLLGALSLLFVPAGVGVVQNLPLLAAWGLPLLAALVISTVATLLCTVGVFRLVARRLSGLGAS